MTYKRLLTITPFFLAAFLQAQTLRFAHVTDTHVGGSTGAEDLERSVQDINSQPIDFILITGDVTEFGSGKELAEAKRTLDQLKKPYFVVPGNHDSKWSESGCNDFGEIFGSETFAFEKGGILFIGTASGPNMRMAPGLVPREQILFLDSVLASMKDENQPVIYINHYPLDKSLSNYRKVIDLLNERNIRAVLLGHGHTNKLFSFEGIPGIMGRSNLRTSREKGGYNIGTIKGDTLYFSERLTGLYTLPVWCKVPLNRERIKTEPAAGKFFDTGSDSVCSPVRIIWEFQEQSDIGSGIASNGEVCVYAGTNGLVTARNVNDGKVIWNYKTNGKIYSTPAIKGKRVVCPSTNGNIYCFHLKSGSLLWVLQTNKSIVASPVIKKSVVYIGSSEGIFRAIDMLSGELIWQYDSIRNFVETRPLLYKNAIYFGSWGNAFYALHQQTGNLLWKREKYANRMLSPAAVWPVAARGKIFIVAPDRRMTALNARNGNEIWDSGTFTCRESIGISASKNLVYIKNMTEGNVDAFYTRPDRQQLAWECEAKLGYEIAPSPITEKGNLIFIPTTGGLVFSINRKTHLVEWTQRISGALINHILPIHTRQILVTTMDGKVACLSY